MMRSLILLVLLSSTGLAAPVGQLWLMVPPASAGWGISTPAMGESINTGLSESCCWRSRWGIVGAGHAARALDAAGGENYRFLHCLARSESPDVSLWREWSGHTITGLDLLEISTRTPTVGEQLRVWRYDRQWKPSVRTITVTGVSPGVIRCAHRHAIWPGDSGSPVTDSSGLVVGMVTNADRDESVLVDGAAILQVVTRSTGRICYCHKE